ncbi:MAG: cellulose synthase operon protein YhjQ/BcsQ [Terracidiphilus sp.]|jgi:cellulose synthase operon protein YhjQ
MEDLEGQFDTNKTPEDVASLYSWANLHGATYRDFSASRAQSRERARQRVEQAMEEERQRTQSGAESKGGDGDTRAEEPAPSLSLQPPPEQPPRTDRSLISPPTPPERPQVDSQPHDDLAAALRGLAVPPSYRQLPKEAPPPILEESVPPPRSSWSRFDAGEATSQPAWLMPENTGAATQAGLPPTPEDTLQGSRERLATRWYTLRTVYEGGPPPAQAAPAPASVRPPVLAVFSLAGGVGKTSLVATLGRALSARGERVLLVDTAAYGLLPFFFGACDQRPGLLRTFSPPASSSDAPIQMITLDPEAFGPESAGQEALTAEISKNARGVGRVIVDLATASGSTTRRIMRLAPQVLIPLIPDMNSVVSVGSIDSFFERNGAQPGSSPLPHYLLNQFDASLPLHLDVREVLREQLGERLLPFTLRSAPAVSEALAEGMTVMDYSPNSAVAEDFSSLAGWVKSLSAPATTSFRGVRWSER